MRTYKISTLGCKVNQQESEALAFDFERLGFLPAHKGETADVCVINSCAVTSIAESKTRQRIRQARKMNPEALLCLVGCLPEVSRESALAIPEVDLVVGSLEKEQTAKIVMEALSGIQEDVSRNIRSRPEFARNGSTQSPHRTRAFIKIEDGCDRYCTYCIVPHARGAVRSRRMEDVLTEAEEMLASGYKELVLTGINLALYGSDLSGKIGLYEMAERICAINANGEYRVRLGSLEPTVVNAYEAVRIAQIRGICPQFHLSLQSGAARTLKDMGRPYTPGEYAEIVKELRKIDPLFSVTTDIIVGFPGESDADFEESLKFVQKMEFAHVHVFKYSKRPGTRAAEMPGQVSEAVKKERSRYMIKAAEEGAVSFLNLNKGSCRRTLIFGPDKSGRKKRGLTDNGIEVLLPAEKADYEPNSFADIRYLLYNIE